jgi:uncharacterized protein YbjQ (UPF0145 family)
LWQRQFADHLDLGLTSCMSVWASGPDVAELACLRGAGFWPVDRVTGCVVLNFAWWNDEIAAPGRRLRAPYPREYNVDLWRRSQAYARLLYQGRRAAAERIAAQCTALGGDGVVGIRIDVTPYPGDRRARQFTATGTAVRAAGSIHVTSPFLAGLTAQDFTKLMHAGWVPVGMAIGAACTWDSWSSGTAPRRWDDGNRELGRWTEAVALAREQARGQMQADAERSGADGVVLGAMDAHATVHNLGLWRGAGGYCIAEATLIGTAIAQFRPPASPQKLPPMVTNLKASTENY